jgi:amino acid transporter
MIDYALTVAAGISAGIGAFVSALPGLQPYALSLCLIVLAVLAFLNLRGIRVVRRTTKAIELLHKQPVWLLTITDCLQRKFDLSKIDCFQNPIPKCNTWT